MTVFRPDRDLLTALLDRLFGEGIPTFAYVDGPVGEAIEADLLAELAVKAGLTLVQAPANGGIGAGLYEQLFPPALKAFYKQFAPTARTIPWRRPASISP